MRRILEIAFVFIWNSVLLFQFTQAHAQKIVKDFNGNIYRVSKFGGDLWMMDNLNATCYQNGDPIKLLDSLNRGDLGKSLGFYTDHKDSSIPSFPAGRLYNYYVLVDPRNVCPVGWRVPDDNDWRKLKSNLIKMESIDQEKTFNLLSQKKTWWSISLPHTDVWNPTPSNAIVWTINSIQTFFESSITSKDDMHPIRCIKTKI